MPLKVHELLSSPDKWTRRCQARDATGGAVPSRSKEATCWCLDGAVERCYPDPADQARARRALIVAAGWRLPRFPESDAYLITLFNDAALRSHAEVLALAKEADV